MSGDDWGDLAATWKTTPEPAAETLLGEVRRLQRRRRLFFAVELLATVGTLGVIVHGWLGTPAERVDVHRWLLAAAILLVGAQVAHWRLRGRHGVFATPAASVVALLDQRIQAENYVLAHLGYSTAGCLAVLFLARVLLPSLDMVTLFVAAGVPTLGWLAYALWRARRAARERQRLRAQRAALGE